MTAFSETLSPGSILQNQQPIEVLDEARQELRLVGNIGTWAPLRVTGSNHSVRQDTIVFVHYRVERPADIRIRTKPQAGIAFEIVSVFNAATGNIQPKPGTIEYSVPMRFRLLKGQIALQEPNPTDVLPVGERNVTVRI